MVNLMAALRTGRHLLVVDGSETTYPYVNVFFSSFHPSCYLFPHVHNTMWPQ